MSATSILLSRFILNVTVNVQRDAGCPVRELMARIALLKEKGCIMGKRSPVTDGWRQADTGLKKIQ